RRDRSAAPARRKQGRSAWLPRRCSPGRGRDLGQRVWCPCRGSGSWRSDRGGRVTVDRQFSEHGSSANDHGVTSPCRMFHACDRVLTFEPNCATSRSTCEDADVTTAGPGRPRLRPRRRPGSTARAEILDAAAELFTSRGFAATSTRLIAEAVGIRQASLYNHFTTKNDILVALLEDTIEPALDFAEALDQT